MSAAEDGAREALADVVGHAWPAGVDAVVRQVLAAGWRPPADQPDTTAERIRDLVHLAVNTAYGTDPRHRLLANAVADAVTEGRDRLPMDLGRHFGAGPALATEARP